MNDSRERAQPNQVTILHSGELVYTTSKRDLADMAEQSESEAIDLLRTKSPEQQSPSRAGQPGPEKKPSTISLVNNDDNDDGENKDLMPPTSDQAERPTLDQRPSNRSFRLDWPSEQYGQQRDWFRESLDCINQFRFNCGMFVNNGHVQFFIIVLICINAIMMGIGTFAFVKENERTNQIFDNVDQTFLCIFTAELGFQLIYHGWRLILDGWLVFDLVIIVTSWSFSSVQIIRAFRIFRALRLVTRIKIMKNLILALFGVMPRMAAIGLMLALIFYIFAVMFTQLFKDMYEKGETDYNYFSGMGWTLFTLFQMMTLDNWASIARQVIDVYKWAWAPFITFVIISGFIVVNLIIAVICDAISALHKDDKAKLGGTYDDNDTDDSDSQQLEIREQLDCLEEQMEELTRIQARTFHTLQYLTRQMQMNKLKQELRNKNAEFDASTLKTKSKSVAGKRS
mmetsp:Transcript_123901/g.185203  ORF Transcript_123901/g.185203 Transcript_123901/m.185203 type:complete len:455 (-) Transcript_123901:291-1655(-)